MEIISDGGRTRRWSATEKLRIVEETHYDSDSLPPLVVMAWPPICCIVGVD